MKICKHNDGNGWCEMLKDYCPQSPCDNEEQIEYVPVVHGRWVDDEYGFASCSNCHGQAISVETHGDMITSYCPWCGAMMEKRSDTVYG